MMDHFDIAITILTTTRLMHKARKLAEKNDKGKYDIPIGIYYHSIDQLWEEKGSTYRD